MTESNSGQRFDRLPETVEERDLDGRATREDVVEWWDKRFGIGPEEFAEHTFWEKGAGKIWIAYGEHPSPTEIEGLGMKFLRTRQEHWKPTTNAVQRFGRRAKKNVIDLDPKRAMAFVHGKDQEVEWDGDWGYLICAHEVAGGREPLGVGLYLHGELRSVVPKGRRRED